MLTGEQRRQLHRQLRLKPETEKALWDALCTPPVAVTCPADAVRAVYELHDPAVEQLFLLALSHRNRVLLRRVLSVGTHQYTFVDPSVIIRAVLSAPRCSAFLLLHNHPSGSVEPSQQDHEVTMAVHQAGKLLGLVLVDHVIFTADMQHVSLRERGAFHPFQPGVRQWLTNS